MACAREPSRHSHTHIQVKHAKLHIIYVRARQFMPLHLHEHTPLHAQVKLNSTVEKTELHEEKKTTTVPITVTDIRTRGVQKKMQRQMNEIMFGRMCTMRWDFHFLRIQLKCACCIDMRNIPTIYKTHTQPR